MLTRQALEFREAPLPEIPSFDVMKRIEEKDFDYTQIVRTSSYAFLGLILVLVLVFVGTGNFEKEKGIEINSPFVDGFGTEAKDGPWLTIEVDDRGKYHVEGEIVAAELIERKLIRKIEKYRTKNQINVTIRGSEKTKVEDIARIMDDLNQKFGKKIYLILK